MDNTNTTKTTNIYDAENRKAATEAKAKYELTAIETMAAHLQTIDEKQRLHAYFLAPYAQYSYTYEHKDENGNISTKTKESEKLFPMAELLDGDAQFELTMRLARLNGRLEMMYTARAKNTRREEMETDARVKLQDIYSMFEKPDEKLFYKANLYDLETMYILSFKKGSLKNGRQLYAIKAESLLENVIYCLWSKLVEKGFTLGMKTQLPPPRPAEAKKANPKTQQTKQA